MPGYNNDEIAFLKDVLKGSKIRPDNMIELPLPFTEESPKFPINRNIALKRTENTLNIVSAPLSQKGGLGFFKMA